MFFVKRLLFSSFYFQSRKTFFKVVCRFDGFLASIRKFASLQQLSLLERTINYQKESENVASVFYVIFFEFLMVKKETLQKKFCTLISYHKIVKIIRINLFA